MKQFKQDLLAALAATAILAVPVVCDAAPKPFTDSNGRQCAKTVKVAKDGTVVTHWVCEASK